MKARLVWLTLCCIWGSTWLFIKLGLANLPPLTFAGIRFVIACLILLLIIWLRRLRLPRARSDWILLALTGVMSFRTQQAVLLSVRIEVRTRRFEIWRIALRLPVKVQRMLPWRQVVEIEFHEHTRLGFFASATPQHRRSDALALGVFQLDRGLGSGLGGSGD